MLELNLDFLNLSFEFVNAGLVLELLLQLRSNLADALCLALPQLLESSLTFLPQLAGLSSQHLVQFRSVLVDDVKLVAHHIFLGLLHTFRHQSDQAVSEVI